MQQPGGTLSTAGCASRCRTGGTREQAQGAEHLWLKLHSGAWENVINSIKNRHTVNGINLFSSPLGIFWYYRSQVAFVKLYEKLSHIFCGYCLCKYAHNNAMIRMRIKKLGWIKIFTRYKLMTILYNFRCLSWLFNTQLCKTLWSIKQFKKYFKM